MGKKPSAEQWVTCGCLSLIALVFFCAGANYLLFGPSAEERAAIEAVKASMTSPNLRVDPEHMTFKTAELNGGIAVWTSTSGAYWRDSAGTLYAANGMASTMSPSLGSSAPNVTATDVMKAAGGG